MPTALLIAVAVAVCLVWRSQLRPKSLDQRRSARVPTDAPVSSDRTHAQAAPAPVTSRITWSRLRAEGLTRPRTCNGRRGLRRRPRIGGKRGGALGRSGGLSLRSPGDHHIDVSARRTENRRCSCANREPKCLRHIGQPSRQGRARPDGGRLCTTRSTGPGPSRQPAKRQR
jgi:hypothetical protein